MMMLFKRITSPADLDSFLQSPTCSTLVQFLTQLSAETANRPNQTHLPPTGLALALARASSLIDETPAQDKDHPSQRFGNRAFRTWHEKLVNATPSLCAELFPTINPAEFQAYFERSFGDATRLDFGTGHEVAFVMLMYVMYVSKLETLAHLALSVVPAYLAVVRKLRSEYRLEPAGSHGVWSLDDYHFLPFVLGSAQLVGHEQTPRVVRGSEPLEDGYMYYEAIADVKRSKRGPFQEHSPMLFELSSLRSWQDVHAGLLKMWKGEVLGKLPVAQHFVFGPSLPATWVSVPASGPAPPPVATDPMKKYFGRGDKAGPSEYVAQPVEGGVVIGNWRITSGSGRILSEQELDQVRAENQPTLDFPFPEMFFGHNFLRLEHGPIKIVFVAAEALKGCKLDKTRPADRTMYKIDLADAWAKRRDNEGKPIPTWRDDFDWTFTTFYRGDVTGGTFKPTPRRIDYEHLKQREQILFATETILYEDDLFDSGLVRLSVKIRVMPSCFFMLCRYFLRVDGNFVRVIDSRFYHVFGKGVVLRETSHREATFSQLGPNIQTKDLLDFNVVAEMTPLVRESTTEELVL